MLRCYLVAEHYPKITVDTMIRALSQLEQAFTITNATYPLSAVSVLQLDKGPSALALQSSIDNLQMHYPFLQSFTEVSLLIKC